MNELEAIYELKKVREYYNMHRKGYDEVIAWLENLAKAKGLDKYLCSSCMFFDEEESWCDARNDGTHPDFGCEDKWKAKTK